MSSSLKSRIQDDIKTAMRARDKDRLGVLRMVSAALKQKEVDERRELEDADVLSIVEKLIKQRRDAAEQYDSGGRPELAEAERAEVEIIAGYLPEQVSDEELDALVAAAVAASGATSMRDMGKVMGQLKGELQGRADMSAVSQKVKAALSG